MTAKEEMDEAIEANMAKGMSREQASKAAFRADPTLQERVVAEANPGKYPDHPRRPAA
jgi:hypothetical protein